MASLYKRKGSPFYWLEYRDMAGVVRQKSTKLRWSSIAEKRQARELLREMSATESDRFTAPEMWSAWVDRFLEQRYAHSPGTLVRYRTAWRNISAFLDAMRIHVPRQLTRGHVRDFIEWRQTRQVAAGCYKVSKNTALHEIKLFRIVMHEAIQSGFVSVNPCSRLGVHLDQPQKKPRITEAEHQKILESLKREPEWMQVSYAIAWEQGCRFSETCLPLDDIDLARNVIAFRTKGRKDTLAEFPLSPRLAPLAEQLKRSGRTTTFDMPDAPSKAWGKFFRRIGLGHLMFHCTRVTFVTRCYEAGISRDSVMRLVGHASYASHAVYPRLTADHSTAQAMRQLL